MSERGSSIKSHAINFRISCSSFSMTLIDV
jgi:hypothetical protein